MKKGTMVLGFAAAAIMAAAQEQLNKEITIEREIVPELRAASRLNLYPQLQQVGFKPVTLRFSDMTDATSIPGMITTLEPANTLPAVAKTPYRGYVDAGYFPAADFGVSAGYTIVSSETTRLNVWGQFDRNSYKRDGYRSYTPSAANEEMSFNRLDGAAGIGLESRFGDNGTLTVGTDFAYSSFTRQSFSPEELPDQSALRWNLRGMWNGRFSRSGSYRVGASFGLFNFGKEQLSNLFSADLAAVQSIGFKVDPVHEMNVSVTAGFDAPVNEHAGFGVGVDGDFVHFNSFITPVESDFTRGIFTPDMEKQPGGKTLGVISFTPHFRYAVEKAEVNVGLRADITTGGSGSAFHIAPDILLAANPADQFGAWLRLGGGEHLNTMGSLFGFTPYFSPMFAYDTSNLPLTGQLGVRIGGFHGFSLQVAGSYAKANDWLLPVMASGDVVFRPTSVKAFTVEGRLNWAFRSWIDLSVGYKRVLGSGDVWYEWRDGARSELSAKAVVRPFEPLEITVGYAMRTDRHMGVVGQPVFAAGEAGELDLENSNDLSVGASYRFTDSFTVFARGENLLNNKCYLLATYPASGIRGLIGVGFKF